MGDSIFHKRILNLSYKYRVLKRKNTPFKELLQKQRNPKAPPDRPKPALHDLRVGMTEKQKENYYKGLIKRLHIGIVDGVLKVVVKKG